MAEAFPNKNCADICNRPAVLTLVPVSEGIEVFRHCAHRSAAFAKIAQKRHEVGVRLSCAENVRDLGGLLPSRSSFGRQEASSVSEFYAARLCHRKAGLCPFRDEMPLMFGHSREDVYREAIRMRIIARYKFDATFKQL